jgi:group I intron endonuclease
MVYGYIYKIENIINGKVYIGQTIYPTKRKNDHFAKLKSNIHYNIHLQRAFNKYGESNFKFTVLNYSTNKTTLDKLEEDYIIRYNTLNDNYGYNLKHGGAKGKLSSESCLKLSESRKGIVFSKEHREKLSKVNKGKKHSLKTREKMSKSRIGKLHPFYGKKHSYKSKKKMSKNSSRWNKGKKLSNEHKQKISLSNQGNGLFSFVGADLFKNIDPEKKCWRSCINFNNHRKSLGMFHDPLSCEIVYFLVWNEIHN